MSDWAKHRNKIRESNLSMKQTREGFHYTDCIYTNPKILVCIMMCDDKGTKNEESKFSNYILPDSDMTEKHEIKNL